MKIYTKKGDGGKSRLKGKRSFNKSLPVFEVLGSLDEFSCALGFLHRTKISGLKRLIIDIQSELPLIGSVVSGMDKKRYSYQYWQKKTSEAEKSIDRFNSQLKPLKSFIIPGGCIESAYLHIARTECRKLERVLVKLWEHNKRPEFAGMEAYINRLADLLFVMARYANKKKKVKEVIWKGSN
jgi:cob(I)alamin adenosyltransferase